MNYSQKIPFGLTGTRFEFTEDKLDYMVKGEKFDYGFVLPYENIYPDYTLKTVAEKWPLYISGIFWIGAVCEFIVGTAAKHRDAFSNDIVLLLFIVLSVIFTAAGKSLRSDAFSLKTSLGNIIILKDANQQIIRDEIELRRKNAIKKKYAGINPLNDPAFELARLRQFKEDGVLSDSEFSSLASQISIIKP